MSRSILLPLIAALSLGCGDDSSSVSVPSSSGASAPVVVESAMAPSEASAPAAEASATAAPSAVESSNQGGPSPSAVAPAHPPRVRRFEAELVKTAVMIDEVGTSTAPRKLFDFEAFHVDPSPVAQDPRSGYQPIFTFDPKVAERAGELYGPDFSLDDKTFFFLTGAWGDSHALYAVDMASGAIHFVQATDSFQIIDDCKDKEFLGKLIVWPHFSTVNHVRLIQQPIVMDGRGRAVGAVGDLYRFLAKRCGVGLPPADPPPMPPLPKHPRPGVPYRCGDETNEYDIIQFLDGTRDAFETRYANRWADLEAGVREACPDAFK